jgi:hypothetical protein
LELTMTTVSPFVNTASLRAHIARARVHLAEIDHALDALADVAAIYVLDDDVDATSADVSVTTPTKVCSCGAAYDRRAFGSLDYVGAQDDGVVISELRNCSACQSTISVAIGPSATASKGGQGR